MLKRPGKALTTPPPHRRGPWRAWRTGALIVVWFAVLMALGGSIGCEKPAPTPLPPTARPTALPPTPLPETATPQPLATPSPEPTAAERFIPPEAFIPTPVPILYKMFDVGSDFQHTNPEYGPVGSIQFVVWEKINPARGAYNWDPIDRQLAEEANLKVTLPDGREIPKPVVIQVFAHLSSAPNWKATFYDGTPGWVYDVIDAENPSDPRPRVNGRKVGHKLEGCGTVAVLPMYDNPTWQKAYFDMVRAFGQRYNNHPQVTAIVINTGLDGETQPVKDWYCDWNTLLDKQASAVRYRFGQFMLEAMDVYREAFPNKHIFINNAPGGSGVRKTTSDYAASLKPPVGLKHSGMWIDLDSHQGYGDFIGSWDMIRVYSMTLPIWLESPFGLGGREHRYWALIAGLHYHPDAIDLHPEFFTQSDPEWLRFAVAHLGVNLHDTPDVWTVLRDAEYPLVSWGKGGVSGKVGDWTFWLYRREEAPQSATEIVWRDAMPVAQDHIFSRQTRRTKQSADQLYMSFDIDDGYPYVAQKPAALPGGNVSYRIEVTLLNYGNDTFSLQYRNWDGGIVSQTRRKGPSLGPKDDWVTVVFEVNDGYLDNNMPGGSDFRISCERDGDEYIHKVLVKGFYGTPPESTPTSEASPTPRPTATSPPLPTQTASATLQPVTPQDPDATSFHPVEDTFLDLWFPNKELYAETYLAARQGNVRVPLLRFDLRSIPTGATVRKATLYLRVRQRSNEGYLTLSAHKVLRAWDQQYANWYRATSNDRWAVPGCQDPLRDLSFVAVDWVELTQDNRWYTLNLAGLVQEWVNHPERNYGLALRSSGAASVQYDFYSLDYAQADPRPRLEVIWSGGTTTPVPPTATPEPTWSPAPSLTPAQSHTPTPIPGPTRVILRQEGDYQGVADTYLDSWAPDENQSQAIKLGARQGAVRMPLIRFDLSGIPAGSSIKSAVLRLYATDRTDPSRLDLNVFKIVRPWDPALVTWNRATASEGWAQPGALDAQYDRSPRVYATAPAQEERAWIEWNLAELVQEWVAAPQTNYGLLIVAEGSVAMQYNLASSEWPVAAFRPSLEIEYVPLPPTATPVASNTPYYTPVPTATLTPSPTSLPATGQYTFQQGSEGYLGCEDTYVDRWSPNVNFSTKDKLLVRQGDIRSLLIRYDLRAIPPTSQVTKALLHLYIQYRSGPHPLPVKVYGVARPWEIAEVTYQRANRNRAWYLEGINGLGQDLIVPPLAEADLSGQGRWVTFDVTRMAQTWVEHPEYNHGLVVKADGGIAVEYQFTSSEWAPVPGLRPRLVVSWKAAPAPTGTPPSPTPPPSAQPTLKPPEETNTPQPSATSADTPRPTEEVTRIVLQEGQGGYEGTDDTYLDGWAQQANRGTDATFSVRQGDIRVGLIRFDLGPMPAQAQLVEGKLRLWIAYASNQGQVHLRAYRLLRPWKENQATWLQTGQGQEWAGPGASAAGQDYHEALVGETLIWGSRKWVELDISPAVRYWLEHPNENYGLLLHTVGAVSVEHQFASSDWIEVAQRPKLILSYTLRRRVAPMPAGESNPLHWLIVAGAMVVLFILLLAARRRRPLEEQRDQIT